MEELTIPDIVDFTSGRGVKEYMQRRHAHSLTLETKPEGTVGFDVPTFGDVQILRGNTGSRAVTQETATATSDLAQAIGLCAACGPKLDMFLANLKKRPVDDDEPLFDRSTGDARVSMTAEDARVTAGGLLEPAVDHWFTQAEQDARLSHGLVRPDAIPDEQMEQLKALMLSRPGPKHAQHKLSLEQLKALGFQQDDSVHIPDYEIAVGGLIIPD